MSLKFLHFLHVINDGYHACIALLLPFIAQDLSLNLTEVGFLGSTVNIFGILLALPAGYIATKYGGAKTLIYALLLYSLGYLASSVSISYVTILIAFALASIGFGVFHPIAFALVQRLSQKETRGRAMANFTAIGDIGRIGISTGVTFLIAWIGWRFTAAFFAFVALSAFFYCFFIHIRKQENIVAKNVLPSDVTLRILLSNVRFIFATMLGASDSLASSALFLFLPFLLLQKGIEPAVLGSFTAAFFIGNLSGKALLGRFVDKFGNIRVFVISEVLMAAGIAFLAIVQSLPMIVVTSVFLGALSKGTVPVVQTLVADATEHYTNIEKALGFHSLLVNIATTLAPIILGVVSDLYGIVPAFFVSAGFALMAIVPAVGFSLSKNK